MSGYKSFALAGAGNAGKIKSSICTQAGTGAKENTKTVSPQSRSLIPARMFSSRGISDYGNGAVPIQATVSEGYGLSKSNTHFAVAGAGTVGRTVVDELIRKRNAGKLDSITVLTRSSGSQDDLVAQGVRVVFVDYERPSSLASALTGIDVVISTLSLLSVLFQDQLIESSKAVGVKLVVPSNYESCANKDTKLPLLKRREVVRQKLEELGLPYAIFCTGLFSDKVLAPTFAAAMGLDFTVGEFSIPGSGNAPISWTTSEEIAQIVVYALTTFSRDKLEWRTFRVEGDRISLNGIVSLWEKRFRKPATVFHRPRSLFKKNPTDLLSAFILEVDAGNMVVGSPEELANAEFPEWQPRKVIDVIDEIYGE